MSLTYSLVVFLQVLVDKGAHLLLAGRILDATCAVVVVGVSAGGKAVCRSSRRRGLVTEVDLETHEVLMWIRVCKLEMLSTFGNNNRQQQQHKQQQSDEHRQEKNRRSQRIAFRVFSCLFVSFSFVHVLYVCVHVYIRVISVFMRNCALLASESASSSSLLLLLLFACWSLGQNHTSRLPSTSTPL